MIDNGFLGHLLLKKGFRKWFLYLFRVINGTPWVEESIHTQLFQQVQDIIDGKTNRINLNICPRSGKSTLATWLVVYALTIDPKAQIIYTSFNQDLLSQISQTVSAIMTHPVYRELYGNYQTKEEAEEVDPIDDFWRDYLIQTEGKIKFSSRKIFTPQGGVVLFNSVGSAITGFGAGRRSATGFSGVLILDDIEKPTDIRSDKIRKKTKVYYVETLLSRLNNSNVPIVNIQQRLHVDDMTAFLESTYGFTTFKAPLLDKDGVCNLPKQYTTERIKELQIDRYTFSAQYQQEPIILEGGVFKLSWFGFYQNIDDQPYRRIFITADTASKTKEWNDYTAIGVWGLTQNNRLRLLDLVHAKMEIPELQATFTALWEKWKTGVKTCHCSAIYIEDKASGTQVIQLLQRQGGLPIMPVTPKADKLTRALDAVPFVAARNIELPGDDKNPTTKKFLDEVTAFSPDGNCLHDDITDCFLYAVDAAYNARGYF